MFTVMITAFTYCI